MRKMKMLLSASFFVGGLAMAAPYATSALQAQNQVESTDCIYGSHIVNEKCNGATTHCCKCKIGCQVNQD